MPALRTMALAAATTALAAATFGTSGPATADTFRQVTDRSTFMQLVDGRTLNYPGVTLRVTPDGTIRGKGLGRNVRGAWQWRGGYFCRDLFWGQRELGANCQMVLQNGSTLRFVSDRGQGQSADLRLR
ncbi:MAG: dihydrodipicolinate reductase [Pseudomonadota bacterium]